MVTLREKGFLGPRFGTVGREHRDHLAQSVKASYRQHLLKPRGWLGSWGDLVSTSAAASNKSTCFTPVLTGHRGQGASANLYSHLRGVGLPDGHLSQQPPGTPHAPLPHLMYSSDHGPLRLPTCFNWNQNTPFRNQGGNSL